MSYQIKYTEDPAQYKDQIKRIWQEFLPDTPPERYEWLSSSTCSAGCAKWFLALDEDSDALLGFITLLPRQFIWKGQEVLFGIMGDFVVDKRYRGFGPAMYLPRHVLKKAEELGFSLIYTIPYYGTIKHIERVGFRGKVHLGWLIKPLNFNKYIRNRFASFFMNFTVSCFDRLIQSIFLNPVFLGDSYFEEVKNIGDEFDTFWEELKNNSNGVLGRRDSRYLTWRFFQNPLNKFRILTLRQKGSKKISGYVVFTMNNGKMDMYDIQYLQDKTRQLLIKQLIRIARTEKCEAIYILSVAGDRQFSTMKMFGFIPSEEEHALCYTSFIPGLTLESWKFLQNDRNV
jgi:predicted acetyltransferase